MCTELFADRNVLVGSIVGCGCASQAVPKDIRVPFEADELVQIRLNISC